MHTKLKPRPSPYLAEQGQTAQHSEDVPQHIEKRLKHVNASPPFGVVSAGSAMDGRNAPLVVRSAMCGVSAGRSGLPFFSPVFGYSAADGRSAAPALDLWP